MRTYQVTSHLIHSVRISTDAPIVVPGIDIEEPRVMKNVDLVSLLDLVQLVPLSVINPEIGTPGPGTRGLSVLVPKGMKNKDFCATPNVPTRVIGVNTNTTEFSIGANPKGQLASRRDSTIDVCAQKDLKV